MNPQPTQQDKLTHINESLNSAIQLLNLTTPQTPEANVIIIYNAIHLVRGASAALESLKEDAINHTPQQNKTQNE